MLDGKLDDQDRGDRRYYRQVRDETRDGVWADRTERGLNAVLRSLPAIGQGDHRVRVYCAATLCEISAANLPHAQRPQIEGFYRDLQGWPYRNALQKLGLKEIVNLYGTLPSDRTRNFYIAYYRRDGA